MADAASSRRSEREPGSAGEWARWAASPVPASEPPKPPLLPTRLWLRLTIAAVVVAVTAIVWAVVLAVGIAHGTTEVVVEYTFSDPGGGVQETAEAVIDDHATIWVLGGLATALVACVTSFLARVPISGGTALALVLGGGASFVASFCVWFVAGFWGDPVSAAEVVAFAVLVFTGCWLVGWAVGAWFWLTSGQVSRHHSTSR